MHVQRYNNPMSGIFIFFKISIMETYKTILKKVAKANELITWVEAYLNNGKASASDLKDLISEVGDILKIEIDLEEWEEDLKSASKTRLQALRADLSALEGVTLEDDVSALYNKVRAKMGDEAEANKVMRRLATMVALVNSEVAKVKEVAELYLPKEDVRPGMAGRMINDDGQRLMRLHKMMKGRKGKRAAAVIIAAMQLGWMEQPTFSEVEAEFGQIGAKAGFNKYMAGGAYLIREEDIEALKNGLLEQ